MPVVPGMASPVMARFSTSASFVTASMPTSLLGSGVGKEVMSARIECDTPHATPGCRRSVANRFGKIDVRSRMNCGQHFLTSSISESDPTRTSWQVRFHAAIGGKPDVKLVIRRRGKSYRGGPGPQRTTSCCAAPGTRMLNHASKMAGRGSYHIRQRSGAP
jgi:hypothetical protein